MISMNNNLDKMIRAAGLQKKVVAERKGVTPETLSRHIHEKVPMTLRDAEDYAEILGCQPYQISYKSDPVKIIGKIVLHNNKNKNDTTIVSTNEFETSFSENKFGYVLLSAFHQPDTGAIVWDTDPDYQGHYSDHKGAIETIRLAPIGGHYVDKECFQRLSWCRLKEPHLIEGQMKTHTRGTLYPEPGGRYTLAKSHCYGCSQDENVYRGLDVMWATPILALIYRPDLREVTYIDALADF
jgi:hypothetical protein